MGAKREMIETRRQASRTQGGKKLVLLGELPVVALVILQHHVNEGAGHEYDDGREQDGEQKSSEGNHAQPPWKQDECRNLGVRLPPKEVAVKSKSPRAVPFANLRAKKA